MVEFNRAHFESLRALHTAKEPYLDPPRCEVCGYVRMPCAVAECLGDVADYLARGEPVVEAARELIRLSEEDVALGLRLQAWQALREVVSAFEKGEE